MSANLVEDLLELLRAGKDVVYIDASVPRRRQLHGYLVARRQLGESHAASTKTFRTDRAAGGSLVLVPTAAALRGAMVDVVLFRGEPTRHDHTTALAAVSVRRGRVDEVAA